MNQENDTSDVLGSRFHFPLGVNNRGGIKMARREQAVEESIRIILGTARGERHMRPQFGSRLHELVFTPSDASTRGMASRYVEEALGWWEPRIKLQSVVVEQDPDDAACIVINIEYQIKATGDKRSLVYPFYSSR